LAQAIDTNWLREGDAVAARSKCWFFCWATTAINSQEVADDCKFVWNQIFPPEYDYRWFEANIGYKFAQKYRYEGFREIVL